MSDLGTIGVGIEFNGQTLLRDIERGIEAVERSAKSASTSFAAFERAGLKVAGSFTYMGEQTKSWLRDQKRILDLMNESEKIAQRQAKAEAEVTKEILRQRDAAEQAAATRARNAQSSIGGNLGLGAQGISASASADAFAAQIENLRNKYDKVYVASNLYEQQLKEITLAHNLGVISADRYQNELDTLNMEYQQYANAAEGAYLAGNRFSQHVNETSRGLNNFGFLAQQVGYQVGDFFVQIQSGTNAFVAFGQQATQLAGLIPGIGGAIAGIGISIATALGAALTRTSEEVKQSISEQEQAYKSLISRIKELQLARQMSATGVGTKEEQLVQNQINDLLKEREQIQTRINSLTSTNNIVNSQGATLFRATQLEGERESLELKQKELDATLAQLNYEKTLQIAASRRVNEKRNEYREQKEANDALVASMTIAYQLYAKTRMEAQGLAEATMDAAKQASLNYGKIQNTFGSGPDAARSEVMANKANPFGVSTTGAGGAANSSQLAGGLGASGGTDKVQALVESLQTEKEITDQWYADSLTTLQSASDQELAIIGGKNEARLRIEQEYTERLAQIQKDTNATRLQDMGGFFGALASVAQAGGSKMVKAASIFSAAQGLINSYVAYTEMLKDPSFVGRPWARFAAAASVLASGLQMVSAIKGVGGGGGGSVRGGGGGGVGSASVPPSESGPAPQTVYINSLQPDAMYSGQALINLFDAFYDENDKRGKVFVVAR